MKMKTSRAKAVNFARFLEMVPAHLPFVRSLFKKDLALKRLVLVLLEEQIHRKAALAFI